GVDQLPAWRGDDAVRDHVVVEHRHQPRRFTMRSYINQRYKITIYKDHDWGELYDLAADPRELVNQWHNPDYQSIKLQLYAEFLQAEMKREPIAMPRTGHA